MRLSDFIRKNRQLIIAEWEAFARTQTPAANTMSLLQLSDHIKLLLSFIADDIESPQTGKQQIRKSHGESDSNTPEDSAATTHGGLRHADGFDIVQMVAEYRALRASITKLWTHAKKVLLADDMLDLTRFNEAIDQALAESVVRFMEKVEYSKDLLLGVLGHDIRSPLAAMQTSAYLLPRLGGLNEKQALVVAQMEQSGSRVGKIVTDLLELTRARMGTGLPVQRETVDVGQVMTQIIGEMSVQYPDRSIQWKSAGDISGEWDPTRLGQAFSNLIANAIQYGTANTAIMVSATGEESTVTICFHNKGKPIPPEQLTGIFASFTRGEGIDNSIGMRANLGLGLFITREIVLSHVGTIDVTSEETAGTTFTVVLPRNKQDGAIVSSPALSLSLH